MTCLAVFEAVRVVCAAKARLVRVARHIIEWQRCWNCRNRHTPLCTQKNRLLAVHEPRDSKKATMLLQLVLRTA